MTSFRPDIAGLRAWAVAAVVLYHFGVPLLTGGFVGVDIFFVISGYLMASIIQDALDRGPTGLGWILHFWLRRAIRIWPALFVMIMVLLPLGWWLLDPYDYKMLALEGVRALLFQSNKFYAGMNGYFDPASTAMYLLHTWSLAVEWWFYVLYPIVCWGAWRLLPGKHGVLVATAVMTSASFIWMMGAYQSAPNDAFYLLPARAWEMGVGGIVFLTQGQTHKYLTSIILRWLEVAGAIFIGVSFFSFNATMIWPSTWTLLPVLGAALVILAHRKSSVLTSPYPMQWLGEASYSIYLWHWPIMVGMLHLRYQSTVVGITLSVLLGWAALRIAEEPLRRMIYKRRNMSRLAVLSLGIILAAVPLTVIRKADGFPQRLPEELWRMQASLLERSEDAMRCLNSKDDPDAYEYCRFGTSPVSLIVIGDSHAAAAFDTIRSFVPDDAAMQTFMFSGCRPVYGGMKDGSLTECSKFLDTARHSIGALPQEAAVLVIGRWTVLLEGENARGVGRYTDMPYYKDPDERFSQEYQSILIEHASESICDIVQGRRVYLLEPVPDYLESPGKILMLSHLLKREVEPIKQSRAEYDVRRAAFLEVARLAEESCGAAFVSVADYFCNADYCETEKDGKILYSDDDHLSQAGAKGLFEHIARTNSEVFREIFSTSNEWK